MPHRPVSARCSAFVGVLFALAPVVAQVESPPPTTFPEVDEAQLDCRVLAADAGPDGVQRLRVEVHNRGPSAAEPLEFELSMPGKKGEPPPTERFARAKLPFVARYGRPIAPGGKQVYHLATALPAKKGQLAVSVVTACGHDGGEVSRPDLKPGVPKQIERQSLSGTWSLTQVPLHNPYDRDLDVLLAVTFVQPFDGVELVGARLGAGATVEFVVAHRPGRKPWIDPEAAPGAHVRATKFEVVDWCLAAPADAAAAAARLRSAYEGWYRWPEAEIEVGGDYTFRTRQPKPGKPGALEEIVVGGRFTFGKDRRLEVSVTSGKGANARVPIAMALGNLLRPDVERVLADNRIVPVTTARIGLQGPGFSLENAAGKLSVAAAVVYEELEDFEVRDGRIVSSGRGTLPRSIWSHQTVDGQWLLAARRGEAEEAVFTYSQQGGRIVPASVSRVTRSGAVVLGEEELVLTGVTFGAVAPIDKRVPTGPGVDALRAIWNQGYRLPAEPVAIEAQFEVAHAGTDLIWQRQNKLRGTVQLQGIGRHLQHAHFVFQGQTPESLHGALAAVIRDRWLVWYGRDFNTRADFDDFFAGAEIGAPTAAGDFPLGRHRLASVSTKDGLVRGYTQRGGAETRFTWQKFGDVQAVVRIDEQVGGSAAKSRDRWTTVVHVGLVPVGPHLLPATLKLEQVFGKDWGPETLLLKNLRLR